MVDPLPPRRATSQARSAGMVHRLGVRDLRLDLAACIPAQAVEIAEPV